MFLGFLMCKNHFYFVKGKNKGGWLPYFVVYPNVMWINVMLRSCINKRPNHFILTITLSLEKSYLAEIFAPLGKNSCLCL